MAVQDSVRDDRGASIVDNDRQADYGDPRPNHERIAALWGSLLGVTITAHDVALMMVLLKVSRLKANPAHADSYTDLHGYAEIAERLR